MILELRVSLDKIKNSKLKLITHGKTDGDPKSIDFVAKTVKDPSSFQEFLVEESILRDLDIVGKTSSALQSDLRETLIQERHQILSIG